MGAVPMMPDGTPLEVVLSDPTKMSDSAPPINRADAAEVAAVATVSQRRQLSHAAQTPAAPVSVTRPADIVKAAKARVKTIRVELKQMKRLQSELAELERLIAAAKQKPVALVRNIDHARHAR